MQQSYKVRQRLDDLFKIAPSIRTADLTPSQCEQTNGFALAFEYLPMNDFKITEDNNVLAKPCLEIFLTPAESCTL